MMRLAKPFPLRDDADLNSKQTRMNNDYCRRREAAGKWEKSPEETKKTKKDQRASSSDR